MTFMVWLSVRVHSMNQNVYLAHSENVLAALPIRATRVSMDCNHTAFFNPKAGGVMLSSPLTDGDSCSPADSVVSWWPGAPEQDRWPNGRWRG
jgi:hypothetical protein